jgi:acyl-CoA synthetase (AMP-forming)/AMP-acid ligase II
VEVNTPGAFTGQAVTDFVGSKIARFKRPQVVAFTDSLPRTAEGAVDRDAVKAKWGEGAA